MVTHEETDVYLQDSYQNLIKHTLNQIITVPCDYSELKDPMEVLLPPSSSLENNREQTALRHKAPFVLQYHCIQFHWIYLGFYFFNLERYKEV